MTEKPPASAPRAPARRLDAVVRELRELLAREPLDGISGEAGDRLGLLAMELEVRGDIFGNRYSRRRVSDTFHMASRFLDAGSLDLRGATVAELGCGAANPLATLLVHLLAGAKQAHGFDLKPPRDVPAAVRGLARIATYMLAEPALLAPGRGLQRADVERHFAGFDLIRLWLGDPGGIDQERLHLHQRSADATGLPDASVDFTYSVSFLEHVDDPAAVAAELARITRPGGCGVHSIDGKDHRVYGDAAAHALDFLAAPAEEPLVHGCNRMRPHEFIPLFERHGMEVVDLAIEERIEVDGERRRAYAPRFRAMTDEQLGAVAGTIFLRRR